MGVQHNDNVVGGYFEPEVTHTFLPGCRGCGTAHPLAMKFVADKTVCPTCGELAGSPGQSVTQRGALGGGFSVRLARQLMWAGEKIAKFTKRI